MGAPALLPPDGPDVNIGGPMLRIIWILNGTTSIVVLSRLYTQGRVIRQLGLGDALMAASLVTLIAMVSMITIQYRYGLGRHFFFLDSYQKVQAIKFSFVTQPLGVMAPAFGRMATCVMMLQLFGTTRVKKWALWFTLWSQLIVNLVVCLLIFVQCKDVRTLWDPVGHPGYCWRPIIQEYTGYAQGAINASADLFLTVLPISIFWTLKITKTLKCGLGILLGLSGIAFVASIVKTVLLKAIGERGDFTFGTVNFFKWVVIEITLVDIAASLPLILPLARRWKKPTEGGVSYPLKKTYGVRSRRGNFRKNKNSTSRDIEEEIQFAISSEQSNGEGRDSRYNDVRLPLERQPSYQKLDGTFTAKQRDQDGLSGNRRKNSCSSDGTYRRVEDAWRLKDLPRLPTSEHL